MLHIANTGSEQLDFNRILLALEKIRLFCNEVELNCKTTWTENN